MMLEYTQKEMAKTVCNGYIQRFGEMMGFESLPEEEYQCEKHGAYKGSPLMLLRTKISPQCPKCVQEFEDEANLIETEKREAERRKERITCLTEMNIGKKFWDESFDTFDAYTPTLKRLFDICVAFANDPQGRMLLMLGKNGNGKNHLAASILYKTGGCIYSVFEIELLLKECYARKNGESDLYKRLCDIPMLVINEIGRHKIGEWETHFLSYIINKRYENLMPTILISNAHLKNNCPQNGCPNCFQNLLGNDVLSRIAETGEIMIFNEDDYRYRKREMQTQEKA